MTVPPPYLQSDDEECRHLLGSHDSETFGREKRRESRVRTLIVLAVLIVGAVFTVLSPAARRSIGLFATSFQSTASSAVALNYLPTTCPGQVYISGYSDPREIVITAANVAGVAPDGFEDAVAGIFSTGQFNKHSVHWIIATKSQGDYGTYFHMVEVEVSANGNEITLCALQAGDTAVDPSKALDQPNVIWAWK
jgi:hypothetical protein